MLKGIIMSFIMFFPNAILEEIYGKNVVEKLSKGKKFALRTLILILGIAWFVSTFMLIAEIGASLTGVVEVGKNVIILAIISALSFPIVFSLWGLVAQKKQGIKNGLLKLTSYLLIFSLIYSTISLVSGVVIGKTSDSYTPLGGIEIIVENEEELNSTVVATVGNVKVTQADYNFIYKLIYDNMAQYSMYYGEDWENMEIEEGKTIGDYIKENTMLQLKQLAAAVILAEEYGIKIDGDIKKAVANQKETIINDNYGGEENFVKFLEETHSTDKAVDTYLQSYEVYNKLYEKLTSNGGEAYIKDADIEDDFIAEYADKMRVQHILVSTQEQTDENGETVPARSDSEAQEIVNEILAKLEKGEDFNELINQYNDDPGISKDNYYVFGDGEMVPEFEEASKNLQVGEYTKEGVKTDYGYHIIKKYEINKEIKEFDEFKNTKEAEKVNELIEKKLESIKVKTEDKVIDSYLEKWAEERKAAEEALAKEAEQSAVTETPAEENTAE